MGVSAPPTHAVGEQTWSFDHWSDGGARTHGVPIVPGTTTVTATYRVTGVADRSNTCTGSPSAVVPSGEWLTGKFGSANDVDWYRFKLTARTRVRLVLGDLRCQGLIDALHCCQIVIHTAAQKYVDLAEQHCYYTVDTNVVCTHEIADLAAQNGVERFVFISTDTSRAPGNV